MSNSPVSQCATKCAGQCASKCSPPPAVSKADLAQNIMAEANTAMETYHQSLLLSDAERQQAADEFHAQLPQLIARMRGFLAGDAKPVRLCACMGRVGADPYCPCKMASLGLASTNPWTPEKVADLDAALVPYETDAPGAATV